MPSSVVKSFAKRSGKSEAEVEKLWDSAKTYCKKHQGLSEKDPNFYACVTGTLKNWLGLKDVKESTRAKELIDRLLEGESPETVTDSLVTEAAIASIFAGLARFITTKKVLTGLGILAAALTIPAINRAAKANLALLREEMKALEDEAKEKAASGGAEYSPPKLMLELEAQMHPRVADQVMFHVTRGTQLLFRAAISYRDFLVFLKLVQSASYIADSDFVRGMRTLRREGKVVKLAFVTDTNQLSWLLDRVEEAM